VVAIGNRLFLKAYRRLGVGINPEFEVGRYLTTVARFRHCVPVAGALEHVSADGTSTTLALLQAYVANQGDGWDYTLDYLRRSLEERGVADEGSPQELHGAYLALAQTLGLRVAQLHLALATPSGDPGFAVEEAGRAEVLAWVAGVREAAVDALAYLQPRLANLPAQAQQLAARLLAAREPLLARIDACAQLEGAVVKARLHGDLHLGQVLLAENDFVIIDFEGEPERSIAERRRKRSPLCDVAGMLRSFGYARCSVLRDWPRQEADGAGLAAFAGAWERAARHSFVEGYWQAARGSALYPSEAPVRALIELFEIEKALYELRYEINNRPNWAEIPLQGLLDLLGE